MRAFRRVPPKNADGRTRQENIVQTRLDDDDDDVCFS